MKYILLSITAFCIFLTGALAQQNANLRLKKPKKYEDKQLPAERTDDKKYTIPRSFIQNTVTHYNYYYNASTKLNDIIARAKLAFADDYTQLLPFYNYTPEITAQFREELDSVIYKATAGILLHDLRSNWVDNLYLLIGKAYYLRNDLDSAYNTFQYLNYAFSPKEKDGYDKVIGSNANRDEGGSILSVSTKENNSLLRKLTARPPSRNEALLWLIKTYLARNQPAEASALIETLKHDPLFPQRLHPSLEEMQALYFYNQSINDSAAFHLERALGNAETKQEQARWEYLIAQLYERAGKHDLAKTFYTKANKHTINPLLEIYAMLNALRQDGSGTNKSDVQHAIDGLVKMAGKDKYSTYRSVIYYTAAMIAEENKDYEGAKSLLLKSIKYAGNDPVQRTRSFLALGDIAYNRQQYIAAKNDYDSVSNSVVAPEALTAYLQRKTNAAKIALQQGVVERQDSLRRIAALPKDERDGYIKKLVRQLRKQRGLKEEADMGGTFNPAIVATPDLFGNTAKGDWYFDNANLKTKGAAEFKSIWGSRPNSDNWRRSSAIMQQFDVSNTLSIADNASQAGTNATNGVSFNSLLSMLPLTPESQKKSQDSTEYALFALGVALQDGPEDYLDAISAYERLLAGFPASGHTEEALFNLYYCYGKLGRTANQQQVKQLLAAKFPNGNYYSRIVDPKGISSPAGIKKREATAEYEAIYDLFIEGKFAQAVARKAIADTQYGTHYWTPQLLYIEAVYHIRQREDSTAKVVLNNIIRLYPQSRLKEKSERLLDVLSRRAAIEDYLARLKIDRGQDDVVTIEIPPAPPPVVTPPVHDTVVQQPVAVTAPPPVLQDTVKAIVASPKIPEPVTPTPAPAVTPKAPVTIDTPQTKKQEVVSATYSNKPAQAHYVAFVMTKVDPVYVSEARNAFNRYNRENSTPLELSNVPLTDDIKLLLFNKFDNADKAIQYIQKAQPLAATDIIPWLTAGKYFFIIVTPENLEALKSTKDMNAYRDFLKKAYPGQF